MFRLLQIQMTSRNAGAHEQSKVVGGHFKDGFMATRNAHVASDVNVPGAKTIGNRNRVSSTGGISVNC